MHTADLPTDAPADGRLDTPAEREVPRIRRGGGRVDAGVVGVALVAALVHVGWWAVWRPWTEPDTASYLAAARAIAAVSPSAWRAERMPGYPLLLVLLGQRPMLVTFAQAMLGVGTTVLLFVLLRRLCRAPRTAAVVSVVACASPQLLRFESTLYTESLAGFTLIATVWAFDRFRRTPTRRTTLVVGACAAGATATRPEYLVPALVVAVACGLYVRSTDVRLGSWANRHGGRWVAAAAAAPAIAVFAAVCALNGAVAGFWGPSTYAGGSLLNHAGGFVDGAPARYAPLLAVYLPSRDRFVAEQGSQAQAVWPVTDALTDVAAPDRSLPPGRRNAILARQLTALSLDAIARHPFAYSVSVGRAWARFWTGRGGFDPGLARHPLVARAARFGHELAQPFVVVVNIAFLAAVGVLCWRRLRRRPLDVTATAWVAAAMPLTTSVVTAFAEYGENGRFGLAFWPLVVLVVCATAAAWARAWAHGRVARTAAPEPPTQRNA